MIDKLLNLTQEATRYLIELTQEPFIYLNLIDLIIVVAIATGVFFFVKYAVKAFMTYGVKGFILVTKPVVVIYEIRKEVQENRKICHTCKNPLYKCTCPSNRDVPLRKRVRKWKKHQHELDIIAYEKKKKNKELNKAVELKQKNKGGR